MDKAKIDKMSGLCSASLLLNTGYWLIYRRANRPNVRAYASDQEARVGRQWSRVPGCHWKRPLQAKLNDKRKNNDTPCLYPSTILPCSFYWVSWVCLLERATLFLQVILSSAILETRLGHVRAFPIAHQLLLALLKGVLSRRPLTQSSNEHKTVLGHRNEQTASDGHRFGSRHGKDIVSGSQVTLLFPVHRDIGIAL